VAFSRSDFLDAATVFAGLTYMFQDTRQPPPDERFVTSGLLACRLAIVVWMPIDTGGGSSR